MAKNKVKKKLTDDEEMLIVHGFYEFQALLIAEYACRAILGVGLLQGLKNIYGDEWEKEGYKFNTKFIKLMDKKWKELNRKVKS